MSKLKKIKDLKKGDCVEGKNGEKIEIISNDLNELFFYNTNTGFFKTLKISKILDDLVLIY